MRERAITHHDRYARRHKGEPAMTRQSYRVPDVGGDPLVTSLAGLLARLPRRERSADILAKTGARRSVAGWRRPRNSEPGSWGRGSNVSPELVEATNRRPVCVDCGEPFDWAARRDPALPSPERCHPCRDRRRAERNAGHRAAGQAERQRPRRPVMPMSDGMGPFSTARCADCGRNIRVPFSPDPARPLYCRSCLATVTGR
jgi:CxxC-x17-CxxC domain-containing protein